MAKKLQKVVVTTDTARRGVFFGSLVSHSPAKQTCVLRDARMAVYWSAATQGVLGLAAIGPQSGSRITQPVPEIDLNGVTSVMQATDAAVAQWERGIWS